MLVIFREKVGNRQCVTAPFNKLSQEGNLYTRNYQELALGTLCGSGVNY